MYLAGGPKRAGRPGGELDSRCSRPCAESTEYLPRFRSLGRLLCGHLLGPIGGGSQRHCRYFAVLCIVRSMCVAKMCMVRYVVHIIIISTKLSNILPCSGRAGTGAGFASTNNK